MKKEIPDNVILVGAKPFTTYMRSIELFLRREKKDKAVIKARGANIKKAIDLAEAARNKFLSDLNLSLGAVRIYTSKFTDDKQMEHAVSCIDIELLAQKSKPYDAKAHAEAYP